MKNHENVLSDTVHKERSTVDKLRVIQRMRALLATPITDAVHAKLTELRLDPSVSVEMSAFLNLMVMRDPQSRNMAYAIFTNMQDEINAELDGLVGPALGDASVDTTDTAVTALSSPSALPPAALEEANEDGSTTTLHAGAVASEAPVSAAIQHPLDVPVEEVALPFPTINITRPYLNDAAYESAVLHLINPLDGSMNEEKFSIIVGKESIPQEPTWILTSLAGLVVGTAGPSHSEDECRIILPLISGFDSPVTDSMRLHCDTQERTTMRVRMTFPSAQPMFSHKPHPTAEDVAQFLDMRNSQFLAICNALHAGYQFLLTIEFIPVGNRMHVSLNRKDILIERREADGTLIPSHAEHLVLLTHALQSIEVVGFLAMETNHVK